MNLQICDELNFPTLRRVIDWKDNEREWKFALPQDSNTEYKVSHCVGHFTRFVYGDASNLTELTIGMGLMSSVHSRQAAWWLHVLTSFCGMG